MASKLDTLNDNFNDNSLSSAKWFSYTGGTSTLNETNSRLECALPASAGSTDVAGIENQTPKDFTSSYALVQIVQAVSSGTNANQTLAVYDDAGGTGDSITNSVMWFIEAGTLYARKYVGGVATNIGTLSFVLATHKWWRLRESGGTVYWDTSTDGMTWTNRFSNAPGITMTSTNIDLECKCYKAETNPGTGIYDNFNLVTQQVLPSAIGDTSAFGTAQVGVAKFILPSSINDGNLIGSASLSYLKIILPAGLDDGGLFGTPAVTRALRSSTLYDAVAKPTTATNPVAKPTTATNGRTKPTTAYSGEVI
jgi:hypothetical protein